MAVDWERRVSSWSIAGVIDVQTAERIREYELAHAASTRTRWSVWLALIFGALLVGSGVLLLVSAGWDDLAPSARLGLVVAMVAGFHLAAGLVAARSEVVAEALHLVGSVALGPAIFLGASILGLDGRWPSAVLLWAAGVIVAWLVRRDMLHFALGALVVPAWLLCEWGAVSETHDLRFSIVGQGGAFLLALAYMTTPLTGSSPARRRALGWLGTIAFLPAAVTLGVQAGFRVSPPKWLMDLAALPPVSWQANATAWALALVIPLAVALLLRGRGAWCNAVAAAWLVVLALLPTGGARMALYGWLAIAAVALGAWGVREVATDRINLATVCFGVIVLFFYFDNVMDKVSRSASLIGLGVLFLAGGYALERVRRRMLARAGGGTI